MSPDHDCSVLSIMQRIQGGRIDPKALSKESRQACVEYLWGEGYSVVETAEVLKVTDRTVNRDRAQINRRNVLVPEPQLGLSMAHRLLREADNTICHIRRICRDKATPAHVKVDGQHRCYQVYSDALVRLQSMGYLPTAAQRIEADILHQVDGIPAYEQIKVQILQLNEAAACSNDPSAIQQVQLLADQFTRAQLSAQASGLQSSLSEPQDKEEDDDQ